MAAPDWTAVRTARPVRDLARATSFYRDLLGLAERGGFTGHDGFDGHHVVLAAVDVPEVQVRLHEGSRRSLRALFELAEDSSAQLDSYIDAGRVLVAGTGADTVVGHLQLVSTDEDGTSELKNMAVRQDLQGLGVGGRLVAAAIELLAAEGTTRLVVATAAAGTGDLRFYQRQGFARRRDRAARPGVAGPPDRGRPGLTGGLRPQTSVTRTPAASSRRAWAASSAPTPASSSGGSSTRMHR